ncbi:hypothetical protein NIES37_11950 [Tolypothrix tenuis PCC 7101]|uniref:Uncharacterized protein n=1 Tax=Tolypothrix tenuis PCC 7101 TaxID=231146 RepID=A0A1Z4MUZ3_9CYAN|nr:hypothetical protein [Aulosira sp. FACHB-113]BAY97257.1 hypothetical protein NIES37_11950 [Tolypothrix tenuis PCC 7101]BAZ72234.1 hypothetical protein NIES50_07870 [Aulosira laxa NIES-50]
MIPIILGAAALATGAIGAVKGAEGIGNMNQAKEIGEKAQKLYESHIRQLKIVWENTNKTAEEYGELQIDVKVQTIGRFVAFIERIGQRGSQNDRQFLAGIKEISIQQIQEYRITAVEAEEIYKGFASAAGAGATAGAGAVGLAYSFGTVAVPQLFGLFSTQVAISQLSGVAALQGTVSFLGGGGMAVGGAVLGGVALGPALAVGGFMLAGKGEEALTKAREYEAKINTEIAKIEIVRDFLPQVRRRIIELSRLVENLNYHAILSLNALESLPFDRNRDAGKFQKVALLIKALAEIMKTPILDAEGQLNPTTATIQCKYRNLGDN